MTAVAPTVQTRVSGRYLDATHFVVCKCFELLEAALQEGSGFSAADCLSPKVPVTELVESHSQLLHLYTELNSRGEEKSARESKLSDCWEPPEAHGCAGVAGVLWLHLKRRSTPLFPFASFATMLAMVNETATFSDDKELFSDEYVSKVAAGLEISDLRVLISRIPVAERVSLNIIIGFFAGLTGCTRRFKATTLLSTLGVCNVLAPILMRPADTAFMSIRHRRGIASVRLVLRAILDNADELAADLGSHRPPSSPRLGNKTTTVKGLTPEPLTLSVRVKVPLESPSTPTNSGVSPSPKSSKESPCVHKVASPRGSRSPGKQLSLNFVDSDSSFKSGVSGCTSRNLEVLGQLVTLSFSTACQENSSWIKTMAAFVSCPEYVQRPQKEDRPSPPVPADLGPWKSRGAAGGSVATDRVFPALSHVASTPALGTKTTVSSLPAINLPYSLQPGQNQSSRTGKPGLGEDDESRASEDSLPLGLERSRSDGRLAQNKGTASATADVKAQKRLSNAVGDRLEGALNSHLKSAAHSLATVASSSANSNNNQQETEYQRAQHSGSPGKSVFRTCSSDESISNEASLAESKQSAPSLSQQLEERKHSLKKRLKKFDADFEKQHNRLPSRAEKESIRALYEEYNTIKRKLDALRSAQASSTTKQQALHKPAGEPTPGSASLRHSVELDKPHSSPVTLTPKVIETLTREKRALQTKLRDFERRFEDENGRKIRFAGDIVGLEGEYRRYKELKTALASIGSEAISSGLVDSPKNLTSSQVARSSRLHEQF